MLRHDGTHRCFFAAVGASCVMEKRFSEVERRRCLSTATLKINELRRLSILRYAGSPVRHVGSAARLAGAGKQHRRRSRPKVPQISWRAYARKESYSKVAWSRHFFCQWRSNQSHLRCRVIDNGNPHLHMHDLRRGNTSFSESRGTKITRSYIPGYQTPRGPAPWTSSKPEKLAPAPPKRARTKRSRGFKTWQQRTKAGRPGGGGGERSRHLPYLPTCVKG